jgi:hypothetical protein
MKVTRAEPELIKQMTEKKRDFHNVLYTFVLHIVS